MDSMNGTKLAKDVTVGDWVIQLWRPRKVVGWRRLDTGWIVITTTGAGPADIVSPGHTYQMA